jgi:RNA recognition motif-containing protein
MNIYVGNLAYSVTEDELRSAFEQFGAVSSVNVVTDRETGRSKGFGFVEMDDKSAGEEAISALNGTSLGGRNMKVNEARPREQRPSRGPRY